MSEEEKQEAKNAMQALNDAMDRIEKIVDHFPLDDEDWSMMDRLLKQLRLTDYYHASVRFGVL